MSEPKDEEKAIFGMAEQALEIALKNCTFRWLFCWDGGTADVNDCGCCLSWDDSIELQYPQCGCICHKRIEELVALFNVALHSKYLHNKSWWWNRGLDGTIRKQED